MTEQDLTPTYEYTPYTPRTPEHEGTRFDDETEVRIDLQKARAGLEPYEKVQIGRRAINGLEEPVRKTVEVKLPPHVTYANTVGDGLKTLRTDKLRQNELGLAA